MRKEAKLICPPKTTKHPIIFASIINRFSASFYFKQHSVNLNNDVLKGNLDKIDQISQKPHNYKYLRLQKTTEKGRNTTKFTLITQF